MTREELAGYDGRDGRKAYGAVNGKIYDFSASPLWADGAHQQQHQAGTDLSEALAKAPHVRAVIERFPQVGELSEPAPAAKPSSRFNILALAGAIIFLLIVIFLLRK